MPPRPHQRYVARSGRVKNAYVREELLLPHLPGLHQLLTNPAMRARRRTRGGADVRSTVSLEQVIAYLREHEITLTWNPATATMQARATQTAKPVTVKASQLRLQSLDQEGREKNAESSDARESLRPG